MKKRPEISVIMPVFNAEKYLRESVQSVLQADYDGLQLWVIDDGSTDQSLSILESFRDDRLKIVANTFNKGVAASLNELIERCSGHYIARMDADDICYPDRFIKQVRYLENTPSVGILGGQVATFTGDPRFSRMPVDPHEVAAWCLFGSPLIHPTVMWRRELGLRYTEHPPTAEDYDLWMRSLQRTQLANLPDKLLRYRQDFGVKKQSYLGEQRSGAGEVRARLLDSLGADEQPERRRVHEKLAALWEHSAIVTSRDIADWLEHLRRCNLSCGLFEQAALERLLGRKWYDFHYYLSMTEGGSFEAFMRELQWARQVPMLRRGKLWAYSKLKRRVVP